MLSEVNKIFDTLSTNLRVFCHSREDDVNKTLYVANLHVHVGKWCHGDT